MKTNELHTINCLEFLSSINDNVFDLVIADPPYYQINGDFDFVWETLDDYLDWCKSWILELKRTCKPTASFYLWGKIGFGKGYPLFKIVDWIEDEKLFQVKNWITQRNSRGRGTKRGYMEAREELVFMTCGEKYTWHPAYTKEISDRKDLGFDGKPRKNKYKRCSDVWVDIAEASQSSLQRFALPDGSNFPTVKALDLCERIILSSSNPGDLVYIPFAGSGSEIVSCLQHKRNFIATEISPVYVESVINPRLAVFFAENEKIPF